MERGKFKGDKQIDVWQDDYSTPPPGFRSNPVTSPIIKDLPAKITSLALDVSGSCNMACRYCAEAATQPKRDSMSEGILKAACDLLLSRGPEANTLRFGSGEPLLSFDLLRKTLKLIRQKKGSKSHKRLQVFITTNGTLINNEIFDWLVRSGWYVKISFDGLKKLQDAWRVFPDGRGSFDRVRNVISSLAGVMPKDRLSVTSVLCRGALPEKVFYSIARLGVKRIELVPVVSHNKDLRLTAEDIKNYREFVFDYAKSLLDKRKTSRLPVLIRFEKRVIRVMGYAKTCFPCGAGRSFLGIGSKGGIYPCFRFIGIEAYKLGHIKSGLHAAAVRNFLENAGRPYYKRERCRQCWAAAICGGSCFACAQMFGVGKGVPEDTNCAYALAETKAAVWLVEQLKRRNSLSLFAFLKRNG